MIVIYELITRKSQITTEKCLWKRQSDLKKIAKMTVTENWDDRNYTADFSVVICDFLVESS